VKLSILNLGPTHTARDFQNVLLMDGERILEANQPLVTYTAFEKIAENRPTK
jgi:NADH:ubiquinone oxidoreductase subunit D